MPLEKLLPGLKEPSAAAGVTEVDAMLSTSCALQLSWHLATARLTAQPAEAPLKGRRKRGGAADEAEAAAAAAEQEAQAAEAIAAARDVLTEAFARADAALPSAGGEALPLGSVNPLSNVEESPGACV